MSGKSMSGRQLGLAVCLGTVDSILSVHQFCQQLKSVCKNSISTVSGELFLSACGAAFFFSPCRGSTT